MFSNELQVAIEAAKRGAQVVLKYFKTDLSIEYKKDQTIVTKADKATEEEIKKTILASFPDAKFVGEESGGNTNQDEFWIIDPIDGTRGFAHKIPMWAILIALCRKGEVIAGVAHLPLLDELLYGEKGKGAFDKNGDSINVSKVSECKKAFIANGSPRHFKDKSIILRLIENSASIRCFEPTSYSDVLVSTGRLDAYVDGYAYLWDAAPFRLLIEEAGGKFTNLDGTPWTIKSRGYISSNGILHDEIVNIVNEK